MAHGEAELFDLARSVLACGPMDEILQRFAGRQSVSSPVAKCGREVSFEPERHRDLLGIVPIAAARDPEHPQPRFAMAAGANPMHAWNLTMTRHSDGLYRWGAKAADTCRSDSSPPRPRLIRNVRRERAT